MLPPHELKKVRFPRSINGYNAEKVDEHIAFLIEQYSALYSRYSAHDKKLRIISERVNDMKEEQDALKRFAVSAQRSCDAMTAEAREKSRSMITEAQLRADYVLKEAVSKAETILRETKERLGETAEKAAQSIRLREAASKERADMMIDSVKEHCAGIIDGFKSEITAQREAALKIRDSNEAFVASLFGMYKIHVEQLNQMAKTALREPAPNSAESIFEKALADIRADMSAPVQDDPAIDITSELSEISAYISEMDISPALPEDDMLMTASDAPAAPGQPDAPDVSTPGQHTESYPAAPEVTPEPLTENPRDDHTEDNTVINNTRPDYDPETGGSILYYAANPPGLSAKEAGKPSYDFADDGDEEADEFDNMPKKRGFFSRGNKKEKGNPGSKLTDENDESENSDIGKYVGAFDYGYTGDIYIPKSNNNKAAAELEEDEYDNEPDEEEADGEEEALDEDYYGFKEKVK